MTEEQKEKYANFLDKVSEILGLNKPVDVLKLCAVTDEYLKPIEKRIAELEKENAELKGQVEMSNKVYNDNLDYSHHIEGQLTKAKEIIEELYNIIPASMADYAKEPMEHARKFMTEE